jgi:hypothetical protein
MVFDPSYSFWVMLGAKSDHREASKFQRWKLGRRKPLSLRAKLEFVVLFLTFAALSAAFVILLVREIGPLWWTNPLAPF